MENTFDSTNRLPRLLPEISEVVTGKLEALETAKVLIYNNTWLASKLKMFARPGPKPKGWDHVPNLT